MATNYSDILLPEEPAESTGAVNGNTMLPADYSDILLPEGAVVPTVTVEDPDAFLNRAGRSINEFQKSFFEGIGTIGRQLGSTNLEEWAKENAEQQEYDIKTYGKPTRTSSLTEGLSEISKKYDDEGLGAAIERGAILLKDMLADAAGSAGVPVAAGIVGALAGPATGIAAVGTGLGILLPFIAGGAAGVGQTREEAISLGADPDTADKISIAAGAGIGFLDRVGAGLLINNLVKQFGKEAVVKKLAEEVGEETAKTGVDKALSFAKTVAVGGTKAAIGEAVTEAGQEALQMSAAGLAAGRGLMPYEAAVYNKRLIDAGALGFVGGKAIGTVSDIVATGLEADMQRQAEDIEQTKEKLSKVVEDNETEIASTFGVETGLRKENKLRENRGVFANIFRTAVSPLYDMARRGDSQARIVNLLINYPNTVSQLTGTYLEQLEPALQDLKRSFRIPLLQREIPKAISRKVYKVIDTGVADSDARVNTAAQTIKNILGELPIDPVTKQVQRPVKLSKSEVEKAIFEAEPLYSAQDALATNSITQEQYNTLQEEVAGIRQTYEQRVQAAPNEEAAIKNDTIKSDQFKSLSGRKIFEPEITGLYKLLTDAGIELNFEENYFPRIYKTGVLARKKMMQVLMRKGRTKQAAASIVDNIEANDGAYSFKEGEVEINRPRTKKMSNKEEGFEKNRRLSREEVEALEEAGLVETDIAGVLSKYILDASRRTVGKQLADGINQELSTMSSEDISPTELNLISDIYDATQNKFKPLQDNRFKSFQKWFLTSQYILTLPLAGLTSLSEPLIILSRISPKYALFGTSKALFNSLSAGLRKFFPKISKTKWEKAFSSILQGADGVLAERFGDISGVTVSRKVTNAFFRATLLTTMTQISRDIAFQATQMQMKDDLKTIRKVEGPMKGQKTKGYYQAKKRLLEQGIVEPNNEVVQNWANGQTEVEPEIIRKSMSKTVDEFIMAPNAINRPLWMSDPHYALAAQLKGFMFAFGNIVGTRYWREVVVPLAKAKRIPLAEVLKYATALTAIMGMSMFIQGVKDQIRYGEDADESPFSKLEGNEQLFEAILRTNIFGPIGFVVDSLRAKKYGSSFTTALLGPAASTLEGVGVGAYDYIIDGEPRKISREIANLIPLLRNLPLVRPIKEEVVDKIEENFQDARDYIVD